MDKAKLYNRRKEGGDKRAKDYRTPSERDLARIIHSAAFRRLQTKTQILGVGEGDFHRTRLTHSMEVAQVGKGIVKNLAARYSGDEELLTLLPDGDQVFCIGLAHDIGHPPFGHGGEVALNYCMRGHGGFEGNGQTLRILSKIEAHTERFGLNLTRRTLLGILKYPSNYSTLCRDGSGNQDQDGRGSETNWLVNTSDWLPPKCYHDDEQDVACWLLEPFAHADVEKFTSHSAPAKKDGHCKTLYKALDTTIMDLADDISYGVHDLEDAIFLGLITRPMWEDAFTADDKLWLAEYLSPDIAGELFEASSSARKQAIGKLVHSFIINCRVEFDDGIDNPFLGGTVRLPADAKAVLGGLKKLVSDRVIFLPEVQTLEFRGQQLIIKLFEVLCSDPARFMKPSVKTHWQNAPTEAAKARIICDYIAGMTDEYATRMYERFFQPRQGTIFQRF